MKNIIPFILLGVFISISYKGNAQFFDELSNPEIIITLTHPPMLGIKINKIAFGPASGDCADQIIDASISDFVSNGIEVIDRQNLQSILAEHNFTLSGYVNKASATAIGQILGPSALIFIKVQRCSTEQDKLYSKESKYDPKTKQSFPVIAYFSRTRTAIKLSIQAVDLTTGRIFAAQTFDSTPELKNKSYDGYPEFPSDFEVQELAFGEIAGDIHRMFLSWDEKTTLYFYDDKAFNLQQAYYALKNGNIDLAYKLSQENLENCKNTPKVKDKILGHAYYNMGMCCMLQNEHDKALELFTEAEKYRPGDIVTKAINKCQKSKQLLSSMQEVEDRANFDAEQSQAEEAQKIQEAQANTLTNEDIIELTSKKIPNSLIIQKIKTSDCKFDTSTDALVKLTNSGVSEDVISIMMGKGN